MHHANQKSVLYSTTSTALTSALLAAVSPFALFFGAVPISLCTLVIYLSTYLLSWKRAVTSVLVYLLLGTVGMPVFSGFTGGLGKLLGPTGGYLLGYLALATLSGLAVQRFPTQRLMQVCGMLAGTALLYLLGSVWYCIQADVPVSAAVASCVLPFLPGDIIKISIASTFGPTLRYRFIQCGLQ